MSNTIKYSEGSESLALNKGNWWIGTGDSNKGPSDVTGYYAGVTPPSSGYTIYIKREDNLPSIFVAENDQELINLTNLITESNFSTIQQCLIYYQTQDDKLCVNREIENIVTDGLVLNLDAGYVPSYPTSGTTWYDLSGNGNDGTLVNGTTFSGDSLVFDGVDDYVDCGINSIFNLSDNDFTIETFVYFDSSTSEDDTYRTVYGFQISNNTFFRIIKWRSGIGNGINIDYSVNGNRYCITSTNSIPRPNIAYTITTPLYTDLPGQWNCFTITVLNNVMSLFINGTNYGSVTLGERWDTNPRFTVGRDQTSYTFMSGKIDSVKIYNKSLSDTEVLQNYNAQKSRFGL
jgi:hypothetical protein